MRLRDVGARGWLTSRSLNVLFGIITEHLAWGYTTSLVSDMGRRTAARVIPTAEPTASTYSNNSAVVFTPVVPVDRVADDCESAAAYSARCREDGHGYVSHPPSRAARPIVPV